MAVPVVASAATCSTGGTAGDTIDFGAPTGWATGDLLVMLGVSEDWNTNRWGTVTGWNRITHSDNDQSVQAAIYWRVATGTESFPITVTAADSDFAVGWTLRITGADEDAPINATGSWVGVGSTSTGPTITEVTTDVADCLGIYLLGIDGADMTPTISSGAGWSIADDLGDPASDTSGAGAQYGTKSITSAGGSGDVVMSLGGTEGSVSIQLAIAPGSSATLDLEAFRWRDESGNEATPTWAAAQNTNITAASGVNRRLRVLLDATGDPAAAQYKLQYKLSTDTLWDDV